jgi:hypothetical protein
LNGPPVRVVISGASGSSLPTLCYVPSSARAMKTNVLLYLQLEGAAEAIWAKRDPSAFRQVTP